jgi:hypothetical protein
MSELPPTRRRWFQFSLRTMLVMVTIVGVWLGVWLGYYVNWKSQRQEARAWLGMQMNGGSFGFHRKPESAFPWVLKLMGEEPMPLILMRYEPMDNYAHDHVSDEYLNLVKRVERLFPEAVVWDLTRKPLDDETEQAPEPAPQS